jgi:hypothetical protein
MDSLFDNIHVNYSEYEYFKGLSDSEQFNFLSQLFDKHIRRLQELIYPHSFKA